MALSRVLHVALCLVLLLCVTEIRCASKDYYETLQVSRGASDSQIKRAYRQVTSLHRPALFYFLGGVTSGNDQLPCLFLR